MSYSTPGYHQDGYTYSASHPPAPLYAAPGAPAAHGAFMMPGSAYMTYPAMQPFMPGIASYPYPQAPPPYLPFSVGMHGQGHTHTHTLMPPPLSQPIPYGGAQIMQMEPVPIPSGAVARPVELSYPRPVPRYNEAQRGSHAQPSARGYAGQSVPSAASLHSTLKVTAPMPVHAESGSDFAVPSAHRGTREQDALLDGFAGTTPLVASEDELSLWTGAAEGAGEDAPARGAFSDAVMGAPRSVDGAEPAGERPATPQRFEELRDAVMYELGWRGMTQVMLAQETNLSSPTITLWKQGKLRRVDLDERIRHWLRTCRSLPGGGAASRVDPRLSRAVRAMSKPAPAARESAPASSHTAPTGPARPMALWDGATLLQLTPDGPAYSILCTHEPVEPVPAERAVVRDAPTEGWPCACRAEWRDVRAIVAARFLQDGASEGAVSTRERCEYLVWWHWRRAALDALHVQPRQTPAHSDDGENAPASRMVPATLSELKTSVLDGVSANGVPVTAAYDLAGKLMCFSWVDAARVRASDHLRAFRKLHKIDKTGAQTQAGNAARSGLGHRAEGSRLRALPTNSMDAADTLAYVSSTGRPEAKDAYPEATMHAFAVAADSLRALYWSRPVAMLPKPTRSRSVFDEHTAAVHQEAHQYVQGLLDAAGPRSNAPPSATLTPYSIVAETLLHSSASLALRGANTHSSVTSPLTPPAVHVFAEGTPRKRAR